LLGVKLSLINRSTANSYVVVMLKEPLDLHEQCKRVYETTTQLKGLDSCRTLTLTQQP
jgi:hypothetical protein